jgi:5'-3' exonuclease
MADQWNTNTSQFFSYYPKYEYLDNVLSTTNRQRLNLYIDVKGCAQALYQEWAVKHILFESSGTNAIDTSLFSAMLEFIAWHKVYAKKRQIDLHMYFFMETGGSKYHLDIYDGYKGNRKSDDFFGLDRETKDLFFSILQKNWIVAEKVSNKIPNVTYIRLNNLEADFVPWYLMKRALPKDDVEAAANIIYSLDKDMLQCLDESNIFQFYRHYTNVKMIASTDVHGHWLKTDNSDDINAEWFPLALAIDGDAVDGFAGVPRVGPKTIAKQFEYVKTLCGNSMDRVYENIANNEPIFSKEYNPSNNALKKILENEEIIIRNVKLASYKLLSDWVDGDYPTVVYERKKQIMESVENKIKCSGAGVLYNALNQSGNVGLVNEQVIINLFE